MTSDLRSQRPDCPRPAPALHLDDLPVDVFEVDGLFVTSLTSGHGMTETGASCGACTCPCLCSCTHAQ